MTSIFLQNIKEMLATEKVRSRQQALLTYYAIITRPKTLIPPKEPTCALMNASGRFLSVAIGSYGIFAALRQG